MIWLTTALRESLLSIAADAGSAILGVYRHHFTVTFKHDASPVTEADQVAHDVIIQALQQLTPDIPILSEESSPISWQQRRRWVSYWLVDPLDGTREFIKKNHEFCINIALIHKGTPVYGVIQSPVYGGIWHALRGEPAYRRTGVKDVQLAVRAPASLPLTVAFSRSTHRARVERLLERIGQVTPFQQGSALKFCRIAEGTVDVYPRFHQTCEWDTAAGQCILHAAGGALLSLKTGLPFRYNQSESLINDPFIAIGDLDLPWRQWLSENASQHFDAS